jgi:hypothetical protein
MNVTLIGHNRTMSFKTLTSPFVSRELQAPPGAEFLADQANGEFRAFG